MSKQPRDDKGKFAKTHGTRGAQFPEKYSDGRTVEGKRLKGILEGIVADLGGHECLNMGDRVTLDLLRSKVMVLLRLGDYADSLPDIIGEDGNLLSVLSRDLLRYAESTEKTLQALYKGTARGRPQKTLKEYMETRESA